MSTLQALDDHLNGHIFFVALHRLVVECCSDIHTTGTADDQFVVFLGVEVEQDFAFKLAFRQSIGTKHAGFLIGGNQSLERSVLQVGSLHDGHDGSHAETIVGTQGSALGSHPVAVNIGLYGVVDKVVCRVLVLLWHHVHVCLQNGGFSVFHTGCGRLAHHDVLSLVFVGLNTCTLGKVEQELLYFLQVSGWSWYLCQRIEVSPDAFRFQVFDFAHSIIMHFYRVIQKYFLFSCVSW